MVVTILFWGPHRRRNISILLLGEAEVINRGPNLVPVQFGQAYSSQTCSKHVLMNNSKLGDTKQALLIA
jgi:hypothetical protein